MKKNLQLGNRSPARSAEIQDTHSFAALADAPNTQRAYSSDWKQFLTWCSIRNKCPLPADSDDLALYARHCAKTLKMSTIQRRLAAIAEAHSRNGHEVPNQTWVVKSTMRRLRRENGAPARGKDPILVKDIQAMVEQCPATLSGLRDRATLLIGFAAALRRSDLVNLDISDVTTSDEGIVLLIRKGKTDQKREGRKVAIPFGEHSATCPVTALTDWLNAAGIMDGPLFRAVTKYERPRTTRMSDRTVAEIVKLYASRIGKTVDLFSGHSLRSGLATSAAIAGASERSIQNQTGHKSLIVLRRYIRDASLFRENVAGKLGL